MNGYDEEGFDEWAETQHGKYPVCSEVNCMERELGVPHREILALEKNREELWAYYHELKARLDQQQRKTA